MESGLSFNGGIITLRSIMRKLGFSWTKAADKRHIIKESHDIRMKRINYLKQLTQYKQEGRPIIYTDQTYIHTTHSQGKEWSDGSAAGLKRPMSKGKRLIIVHAGGATGFVPNALLIFPSGRKTGDYHDDMNFENFSKWVRTQLLPNLPPRSVLVVDNAPYHNVGLEKHLTSNSLKNDMIRWLVQRNIPHNPSQTKTELYETIKVHKPTYTRYALDTLLSEHGHVVLRLPPYHPELNPIEHIWAIVKNWVAARNVTFKMDNIITLTNEKFRSITQDEWQAVCGHTDKVVQEYLKKEHMLDDALEHLQFVVNTGDSDDSDVSGVEALAESEDDN